MFDKIGKLAYWFAFNSFAPMLIASGVYFGMSGLTILGILFIWLINFVGIVCFAPQLAEEMSKDEKSVDKITNPTVPFWMNVMIDIPVAVFIASVGYPITAFFFIVHILGYYTLIDNIAKIKDKNNDETS